MAQSPTGKIENVSDTARWVAVYRAMETDRPDAHFRDPWARRLAGPEGEAMVDRLPRGRGMAWAMITRTKVFDEIILELVRTQGVDLVLNLAAGLDARPWRLDLPKSLRWVDVDMPVMINHKSAVMKFETPRCRYEAIPADLADSAYRPGLFKRIVADAQKVLVVSEGLLIYLTEDQVASLAADLAAIPAARWWLFDLASNRLLMWMRKRWQKKAEMGTAQFKFAPDAGTAFFEPYGWTEERYVSAMDAAQRLNREMKGMWFWRLVGKLYSQRAREQMKRFSGHVLLRRKD